MSLKPLWPDFLYKTHQEYGIKWMMEREADTDSCGGLLCDEMGLGKTIEMLGLIAHSPLKKTLIVLPLAVINQWKETAIKSRINVLVFHAKTWKLDSPPFSYKPFLYLIGYESLANNIDDISSIIFDRLVCDEAHRLGVKKIASYIDTPFKIKKVNYNAVSRIVAKSKWFLTATPIVNSTDDVLTLFSLINPRLAKSNVETLMGTYALARTMDQLRSTMPDAPKTPIIQTHKLDFVSKEEEDFYVSIQGSVEKQMSYRENVIIILRLILLLRQLSIHPQVYISSRKNKFAGLATPDWVEPSTKFVKMKELMEQESHEQHKWIVFCHFHEEMEMLEKYFSTLEFVRNIATYSGELSQARKEMALNKVREPFDDGTKTCDILLIQIKAGGVGLNLQEFDRIIFSSPWWTQAAIDQGIGRAVRIGQTKQVIVHNLVLKQEDSVVSKNIDNWMKRIASQKDLENKMALSLADSNIY